MNFGKIIGLGLMVFAVTIETVSAANCLNMKGIAQVEYEKSIYDTCRELSGKNINPAKRKVVKQSFLTSWNSVGSQATLGCATSCGASSSCVDEYIGNFIKSGLNEVIPKLTAEWCNSGS